MLAHSGSSGYLTYQVYFHQQNPVPPSITSAKRIPADTWFRVVVTQTAAGFATMYWNSTASVAGYEVVAQGNVNAASAVVRSSNFAGISNWQHDVAFEGQIQDLRVYDRVLLDEELAAAFTGASSTSLPTSSALDLCADAPAPPPPPTPSPPQSAAFTLDVGEKGAVIDPNLYVVQLHARMHSREALVERHFLPSNIPSPRGRS